MISLTGILSLLSALAATSYALSCTQCISLVSSCSGSSVPCSPGYQCGLLYTESILDGHIAKVFDRRCLPTSECDLTSSVSQKQGQIRKANSCCDTDDCTPPIPSFPANSSEPNGLVCPSCVSFNSTSCSTSDTAQCRGNETMCLLQTATGSQSGSSAVRGCATKSVCDLGSQSQSIRGSTTEVKYICTSGGISVRTVVLTPPIACLLLLKWFF